LKRVEELENDLDKQKNLMKTKSKEIENLNASILNLRLVRHYLNDVILFIKKQNTKRT
jgi:hypothetical protein